MKLYLQADVPAALPHHLQLCGLLIPSLPQQLPDFIIDVEQVVSVITGIPDHFFWQRARKRDTINTFQLSCQTVTLLLKGVLGQNA